MRTCTEAIWKMDIYLHIGIYWYIYGYIHPGRRGRERPSTGHSLRVYGKTERTPRMLTRRISLVLVRMTRYRLAIILITQHVVMSTSIRNILHSPATVLVLSQPRHSQCLYAKTERIRTLYIAIPLLASTSTLVHSMFYNLP